MSVLIRIRKILDILSKRVIFSIIVTLLISQKKVLKEIFRKNFPESVQNQFIHNRYWNLLYQTRSDHESFIIYSRILMDNIPVVAKYLLNNHNLLSPFCDQK